uniref:Putative golgi apparatus n=1 Tax=Corethrella appendiculata TaxID=1370023 RepID=U5EVW3_9DIPT
MVTIVPSRFAGLKIEDDEDEQKQKSKNKNQSNKKPAAATNQQIVNNKNLNKTQKPKKSKKQLTKPNPEEWQKWQQKDSEQMQVNYEKDLEEALLLSKLEFESNKCKQKLTAANEQTQPQPQKGSSCTSNSSNNKKGKPLSLQEFHSIQTQSANSKNEPNQSVEKKAISSAKLKQQLEKDLSFFEKISNDTKNILKKEQSKSAPKLNECPVIITTATTYDSGAKLDENSSHQDETDEISVEIEKDEKDLQIDELRAEVTSLRSELDTIKSKYKKISSILRYGEMKDKTELLMEIETLKKTQAEMTKEITSLYAELEQEKTKSHNFDSKFKEKINLKKNVRFNEQTTEFSE